jgi:hypothetical protein
MVVDRRGMDLVMGRALSVDDDREEATTALRMWLAVFMINGRDGGTEVVGMEVVGLDEID